MKLSAVAPKQYRIVSSPSLEKLQDSKCSPQARPLCVKLTLVAGTGDDVDAIEVEVKIIDVVYKQELNLIQIKAQVHSGLKPGLSLGGVICPDQRAKSILIELPPAAARKAA